MARNAASKIKDIEYKNPDTETVIMVPLKLETLTHHKQKG